MTSFSRKFSQAALRKTAVFSNPNGFWCKTNQVVRNPQILATEIFKTKNGLKPVIVEDVFKCKNVTYNFQNVETLNRTNVNSVKYGTETITSLGAKTCKILRNDCKELTS